MRTHFEAHMHERQSGSQDLWLDRMEAKLDTEDWAVAAQLIEDRLTHGEQSRQVKGNQAAIASGGTGEIRLEEFFAVIRGSRAG